MSSCRSSRPAMRAVLVLASLAVLYPGVRSAGAADGDVPAYEMPKVTPVEVHGGVGDQIPTSPRQFFFRHRLKPSRPAASTDTAPVEPPSVLPLGPMPAPTQSFAGLSFADTCGGVRCGGGWPPDTNGDVGPNHYVQAVNNAYAVYSKTGTLLASFTENQLWSAAVGGTIVGGAGVCASDSFGDPVVLYDRLADRWILTHFAFAESGGDPVSPFYQCLAASKSGDPVAGGWWLYAVRMDPGGAGMPPVGALNDYSKFGIWPDCLYMAANEFQFPAGDFVGVAFASFSRSDLYSGAPLTWSLGFIDTAVDPLVSTMIPSNLLGTGAASLPPPASPNYFVYQSNILGGGFKVRKFTAGANCGAGGMLGAAATVSQTAYTIPGTVPQPNTTNRLDSIDDRLLQNVQYRKLGAAESLWVVHNVQTTVSGSTTVKPQWAQLDVTSGVVAPTPVQQQIYAPDTTLHRWMGSLAVDRQGNMALGYSTSNGSAPNFPSIAYAGRLVGDPLNTLPQSEVQLVAGGASQTNNCGGSPCDRWGDYSAMSIDPADDCTFWYTNEYYDTSTNGANGKWQTRIGSFKFPSCVPGPSLTIVKAGTGSGTVTSGDGTINCGVTCFATVTSGTQVTLAASPAANSTFVGWSGGCSGTGPCTVMVTTSTTVTATFALQAVSLTVVRAGTGAGTVTSNDGNIVCGSTCSEVVASGTPVTLTPTPASGSSFAGWTGGGCSGTGACTVTVTAATTVTATFTLSGGGFSLTVTKLGSGTGTVTSGDGKISCGSTCAAGYTFGATVVLTATAGPGATFKQWGGACSGTSATCTVMMVGSQAVTATFAETFTDGVGGSGAISAGTVVIKAVHVLELRTAIDNLRAVNGLGAYGWTDPTLIPTSTVAKRIHFLDLRTALSPVCAAFPGKCTAYSDATITAGQTPIKAAHLNELRANVRALE